MEVDILENISRFIETLQHIFSLRRTKITLYIATVLWIAFITQIMMNKAFLSGLEITEAFVKTNAEDRECSLELVAPYHSEFLSEADKKDILYQIADFIGLNIDTDISIVREARRTEYSYHKQAKLAETTLKIVSLQEEQDKDAKIRHYIVVRLKIKESIKSLERYRELIEEALDELKITERQVNVLYEGIVDGIVAKEDKEELARSLVKDLQGEAAFDYQEGNSYTLYAYTGLIDEYIETVGYKINIQIAMTYDELSDKTRIYLASPIINESW
jgi:hypothetical protein